MPKVTKDRKDESERPTMYVGIDPGKTGGLVAIDSNGIVRKIAQMPETELDILSWLHDVPDAMLGDLSNLSVVATIEVVNGYVGGKGQPGSSMFNFGMGYGGLRMAAIATGCKLMEVRPQQWQAAMGCGSKAKTESKTKWKDRLRAKAQREFPGLPVWSATLGEQRAVCDALLIAEYGRRKDRGLLK